MAKNPNRFDWKTCKSCRRDWRGCRCDGGLRQKAIQQFKKDLETWRFQGSQLRIGIKIREDSEIMRLFGFESPRRKTNGVEWVLWLLDEPKKPFDKID